MMATINAELMAAPWQTRHACHACGGQTEKVLALCEVPKSHSTHAGFRVCETCLKAGDIDARLSRHADALLDLAAELRGLVGRLRVPTYAEWLRAEQSADVEQAADAARHEGVAP